MPPRSDVDPSLVPSSLDLLALPFAFTQRSLLTDTAFLGEAKKRGYNLNADMLEWLHRRGVLVPLFRLYSRRVGPTLEPESGYSVSMNVAYLYEAASEGQLRDAGQTRFRPWPTRRIYTGVRFSWFQLLALRYLKPVIMELESSAHVIDDRDGTFRVGYSMPPVSPRIRSSARRYRALAIVLEVLSPRYSPRVLGRVMLDGRAHYEDELRIYRQMEPVLEQAFLSKIPSSVLLKQAERWLFDAHHFDPLGDWHEVVRLSDWRHWEQLRYDALDAMELRIAADMLIHYYEDLAEVGTAEPLPDLPTNFFHPRYDRLKVTYSERAKTLQRFRLFNSPAVVVVVEGHTEMKILPRVLELAHAGPSTGLVTFVNLKSIDADIKLVARSVAVPVLLSERPGRATILRQLIGLVVAVDQENRYDSQAAIESQKEIIVNEILESLPQELRTDMVRSQIEQLVIVTTWGNGGCFEFAHFTDRELAEAILRITDALPRDTRSKIPAYKDITAQLARQRSLGKDIKNVWDSWRYQISKQQLAEQLWPVLRTKLASDDRIALPIVRVSESIIDLAVNVRPVTLIRTS